MNAPDETMVQVRREQRFISIAQLRITTSTFDAGTQRRIALETNRNLWKHKFVL